MIDDTGNDSRAGSASGEETKEAALIANFYGPRRGLLIEDLHEKLYRELGPKPRGGSVPYWWQNQNDQPGEIIGRRFGAPGRAAVDTTVLQLALNAPDNAAEAWKTMRQNFENILKAIDLSGLWGYTLVYQAVLNEHVDPDRALNQSIASIRRLNSPESFQPLAWADVPGGGRVWLLAIPDRGNGWAAGTVYCALGPSKGEKTLLDLFYGPTAKLLTPDLIAHKGYYQMRQYRGEDLEREYEKGLQDLRQTTAELLQEMELGKVESSTLKQLSKNYYHLAPTISRFKELHTGMLRQRKNYDLWQKRDGGNGVVAKTIIDSHSDQLEAAGDELKLMVEPLEDALDKANNAVSLAQAQENKKQEALLTNVELLLAFVTFVLAEVELLTWEAPQDGKIVNWLFDYKQVIMFIVFLVFMVVIWRLLLKKQKVS